MFQLKSYNIRAPPNQEFFRVPPFKQAHSNIYLQLYLEMSFPAYFPSQTQGDFCSSLQAIPEDQAEQLSEADFFRASCQTKRGIQVTD